MLSKDLHAIAKKAAGYAAAELIQSGMRIGIGTGSTVAFFIERLAVRCQEGLQIKALATSLRSEELARQANIPLIDAYYAEELDIAVDGADRVDAQKRMIKGGGGALLREKIVASMAQEMIVIIDQEKIVETIGGFPLPVEILPFAFPATIHHIEQQGLKGNIRLSAGKPYRTDNGNYIFDIDSPLKWADPEKIDSLLKEIPGIIETGFFFNLAGRVIIGDDKGQVRYL